MRTNQDIRLFFVFQSFLRVVLMFSFIRRVYHCCFCMCVVTLLFSIQTGTLLSPATCWPTPYWLVTLSTARAGASSSTILPRTRRRTYCGNFSVRSALCRVSRSFATFRPISARDLDLLLWPTMMKPWLRSSPSTVIPWVIGCFRCPSRPIRASPKQADGNGTRRRRQSSGIRFHHQT